MDVGQFCSLITEKEEKIVSAISSSAQWEVWLQVEIFTSLISEYRCGGREVKLDTTKSVDLAFSHESKTYLVELKVESAHHAGKFAGKSLEDAVNTDVEKLSGLSTYADDKWVCCVAWSPTGKVKLQEYGFDYIQFGDTISVAIKKV